LERIENLIIKKIWRISGLNAKEFAEVCQPTFSRSRARGMLAAEGNRRYYKARTEDVWSVLEAVFGIVVLNGEIPLASIMHFYTCIQNIEDTADHSQHHRAVLNCALKSGLVNKH